MAFGQAIDLAKVVGGLIDVFRHKLSQAVNIHFIKDMIRSSRIYGLEKSVLLSDAMQTPLFTEEIEKTASEQ
jgi:hypothetical protein